MLFSSLQYLIFFPIVLPLYWLVPLMIRRYLLLIASYVFYMSWLPVYGLLILILATVNFVFGLLIERAKCARKAIFIAAITINVLTLCYYKYTNFLISSVIDLLKYSSEILLRCNITMPFTALTIPASSPHLDIILPLGISFFAFEFIHYLTDVYKGTPAVRNWVDFSIFAAFFPSQICGPIKRFQDFMPQLKNPLRLNKALFEEGLFLILKGLFKKISLADNLSPIVNAAYLHPTTVGTADAWLGAACFGLQVYFDFSGYTDMGRGSALLLGIRLPENFNMPLLSTCMSDYWRRWHMSLSSWLRDYLYFPLGGSRLGRARTNLNLFVTMALGGLWHGSAWHFVFWGGFHGVTLIISQEYDHIVKKYAPLQRFHAKKPVIFAAILLTIFTNILAYIIFRATSVTEAAHMAMHLFVFYPSTHVVELFCRSQIVVALAVYLIYTFLFVDIDDKPMPFRGAFLQKLANLMIGTMPRRIALFVGTFIAAIGLSPLQTEPFVYFQF